jgi:peptidoglycan/LPS O-acetylase OafA/YrhL
VLSTARATAPLRFCGRMCYSLYLTHPLAAAPVAWACYRSGLTSPAATVLVTLPLCAILSVGLGYAFHRVVERRFLNAPSAPRSVEIHPAASAPLPA